MPVRNGARYLKQALESVLGQTFNDFEFLIINDGSTDETEEIAKGYANKDDRVKVINNEKNLGLQKTLNKGVELSQGEYIARIDCDDIWLDKKKLQKQVSALDSNSDIGVIGTGFVSIDENEKELFRVKFPSNDEKIRNNILTCNQLAHPSVVIRKKALDELGKYSEKKKYQHIEDYELWLRIGKKYKFANLDEYCLGYRIDSNGISLNNQFKVRFRGLLLSVENRKAYPHGIKAIFIKILSFFIFRSALDFMMKKSKPLRKLSKQMTSISVSK